MKLSKNFTLEELTATATGLDNTPPPEAVERLRALTVRVLQPARDALDIPLRVTSGYRNEKVNRLAGGAAHSQHTRGEAADLTCEDNARLFRHLCDTADYDQLIWEHGDLHCPAWIHVSYAGKGNRRETLQAVTRDKKTIYRKL